MFPIQGGTSITTPQKIYSNDLFSAYPYKGYTVVSFDVPVVNDINLAGSAGGLVWIKNRTEFAHHVFVDTVRGKNSILYGSLSNAAITDTLKIFSFNTDGFTAGKNNGDTNGPTFGGELTPGEENFASWTFRIAPKFFDIVTYTGDGAASRILNHNLGVQPGFILIKSINAIGNWAAMHRGSNGIDIRTNLQLNSGALGILASNKGSSFTATTFDATEVVEADGTKNNNNTGTTYVAYLFAHDTSTDGIIRCGVYTGGTGKVELGWEPQFVITKGVDNVLENWVIFDSARGMYFPGGSQKLYASINNPEGNLDGLVPVSTGFFPNSDDTNWFGRTYIYIAIRKGQKPAAVGTEIYKTIVRTGNGGSSGLISEVGFRPDLITSTVRSGGGAAITTIVDRTRGPLFQRYITNSTSGESQNTNGLASFLRNGFGVKSGSWNSIYPYVHHCFKRAIGIIDVLNYIPQSTTIPLIVNHALEVVPELIIIKSRSTVSNWRVHAPALMNNGMALNTTGPSNLSNGITSFTSTSFTVSINETDFIQTFVHYSAFLFASKAGISKVGKYTGNGTNQTIDCQFFTGSRFVMIKRIDAAGDWYIWDNARGIIASGNDPHLSLNTEVSEVTTDDSIDLTEVGFIVNQVAATNINVLSATYLYLTFA